MSIDVQITRLPHGRDLPLPAYQSAQAAGIDLLEIGRASCRERV